MAAIADEIAAAHPDVVGRQEVTTWTTFTRNPQTGGVSNPVVAYDFLNRLLDELAARGADYREVPGATAHNFASPPIPISVYVGGRPTAARWTASSTRSGSPTWTTSAYPWTSSR